MEGSPAVKVGGEERGRAARTPCYSPVRTPVPGEVASEGPGTCSVHRVNMLSPSSHSLLYKGNCTESSGLKAWHHHCLEQEAGFSIP